MQVAKLAYNGLQFYKNNFSLRQLTKALEYKGNLNINYTCNSAWCLDGKKSTCPPSSFSQQMICTYK